MMKKLIFTSFFVISLCLLPKQLIAQQDIAGCESGLCIYGYDLQSFNFNGNTRIAGSGVDGGLFALNTNPVSYNEIEGIAYSNEVYKKGSLVDLDNNKFAEHLLRYNAYTDEMETVDEYGKTGVLIKSEDFRIILNDNSYAVMTYTDDNGDIVKGYFIEKVRGDDCSLFLKEKKILKKGQKAKTSYHKDILSKFVAQNKFYLKMGFSLLEEMPSSKNKVLNRLANNQDKLKQFVSQEKTSFSKENDLIDFVVYYNGLQ